MRRVVAPLLAVALVVAACNGGDDDEGTLDRSLGTTAPRPSTTRPGSTSEPSAPDATVPPDTGPAPPPPPAAPGTPPPTDPPGTTTPPPAPPPSSLSSVRVQATRILQIGSLTAMAVRPGHDAVFLAERAGRLRVVVAGRLLPDPVLAVETSTGGERGLLGIAFSPDGGRLYLSYTDPAGDSRLDEVTMGPGATEVRSGSRRQLLHVAQPASNHNGGQVAFGPDGHLYLSLGDGGGGGDPFGNGQDTGTLLGSILRIDPRPSGGEPYSSPPGNPFLGGGGRPEVYIYGLRNPWRFTFDRATGDLWIGDVGQNRLEEVDLLPAGRIAGANLGWSLMEGTSRFNGDPPADHVPPVYEYPNAGGTCGVIGGYVYRGSRIPGLQGVYVFADLCESAIRGLLVEGGRAVEERVIGPDLGDYAISSFGEDAGGELYVLTLGGVLYRIDPT